MYDNYLSVNKKFKSSVNLQYDLYDEEKISQYIPTSDLCDVLKTYAKSVLGKGQRATLLAGPYGKGKSYLTLMLTFLFSKRENRKLFKHVISKIKLIDKELYELLTEIDDKKISLLPVIINSALSSDLTQTFMIALNNALSEHGMDGIIPDTAYTECLSIINKWERDNNDLDILSLCKNKLGIKLEEIKSGLLSYDLKAYNNFKELFSCVTHGYSFNPLVNSDIGNIYQDVSREINKYGFGGMFIVFDEFGIFLENQTSDYFIRLNIIQSFAEKCESSDLAYQMHFCCITHKDITLYDNKNKQFFEEFKKISGRFLQIRFDRSLDENYQIICQAIDKKDNYENIVNDFVLQNQSFIYSLKQSPIFNDGKQVDYIINNGLPFNPITLYSLIQTSEKIAQNERTLFTFISDNDVSSLEYFIANNDKGLMNVPLVYDYFESTILNESLYKSIYFKVEALNKKTIKDDERSIFKVIAIMKIVDDNIKFNSTIHNIALCLNKDYSEVEIIVNNLIQRNLLKQNLNDGSIDFALISDAGINELLQSTIVKSLSNYTISSLLNKFDTNKYYVSNEYNFNNKITRFYEAVYVESSVLMNMSNFNLLFNNSDGLLINVINDAHINYDDIKQKIFSLNQKNIIVRFNNHDIDEVAIDKIKYIFAAKLLLESKNSLSDSLTNILPEYIDDLSFEVSNYLKNYFSQAKLISVIKQTKRGLSQLISDSLSSYFSSTIPFNNEQVNKNFVSAVTIKSRDSIVDDILTCEVKDYSPTSQEYTIRDSLKYALQNKNSDSLLSLIKKTISESNCKKTDANQIIKLMKDAPYGMRDGIIPLYLSKAISDISIFANSTINAVILYRDNFEIEINASNLAKVVQEPTKYKIGFTQIEKDKLDMLNDLMRLFECKRSKSLLDNVANLVKRIKNYVSNLPPIIVNSSIKDNVLSLTNDELLFKELFLKHDINNYEIIFEVLPERLQSDYCHIVSKIGSIMKSYSDKLNVLYVNQIELICSKFGKHTNEIKSSFDLWKCDNSAVDNIIFENNVKNMYKAFLSIQYNNYDALNKLSYAVTKSPLDDWNEKKQKLFNSVLDELIASSKNNKNIRVSVDDLKNINNFQLSSLGTTLKSNIEEIIDEYGSSISNEEKAAVLKSVLNNLLN